jgi:hypothetical protein
MEHFMVQMEVLPTLQVCKPHNLSSSPNLLAQSSADSGRGRFSGTTELQAECGICLPVIMLQFVSSLKITYDIPGLGKQMKRIGWIKYLPCTGHDNIASRSSLQT